MLNLYIFVSLLAASDAAAMATKVENARGPTGATSATGAAAESTKRLTAKPAPSAVRCGQIIIISCYLTPNESIGDFQAKLDFLEDAVRHGRGADSGRRF